MKTLIGVAVMLVLAACGEEGTSADTTPTPTPVATIALLAPELTATPSLPIPTSTPTSTPTPTPVSTITLTVYSRTVTLTTTTIGSVTTSIEGTGSCVVYQGVTYCWDDGTKVSGGTGFQYWGLEAPLTICPNFTGGCVDDLMLQPRIMSINLVAVLDTIIGTPSIHRTVNQVLTSGNSVNTDCVEETDGTVDCGSFVIDTNQSPL